MPGEANVQYYRRRAAGGVGLIITEGVWIDHPTAGNMRNVPQMHGQEALAGWRSVVEAVHAEGAKIFPQLWHVGMTRGQEIVKKSGLLSSSPSGLTQDGFEIAAAMTQADIDDVIDAYARAAKNAFDQGFDGVELHGAHGYLIDQFFWQGSNRRSDRYGGNLAQRTRFACEIVREVKKRTDRSFPLSLRISQWKQQDYAATLASTPEEWASFLRPLCEAGVDIFHVSTRRFRDPAFAGSDETLPALTRKITGRTVITVGSIGLTVAKEPGWEKGGAWSISPERSVDDIELRLRRGDFDLFAVGRVILANPAWPALVRQERFQDIQPYTIEARDHLV
ncbi:MAG: 12-oxophytodienoate reductase [Desulfobacterales bacterium]|nr:12-oxophytodienoate reductase [Desulfobacterales bacterium]